MIQVIFYNFSVVSERDRVFPWKEKRLGDIKMHRVCFPACSCVIRENLVSLNVKSLFSQTVSANNTLPCSARCSLCSALILPYCAANSEFHTFSLIATSLFVSLHRSPSVSTPKTRGNVLNPPLRAFLIQH